MTVAELKAKLVLAEADGHGSRVVWIKQEDGELKPASRVEVVIGDYEYYPNNQQADTFCVIECPQV